MERFDRSRLSTERIRVATVILAILANVAIILIARGIAGAWPRATTGSDEQVIRVGEVIAATVVAGIVALLVAVAITRQAARPARIWLIVGVVCWAISLFSLAGAANTSSAITLGLLHTITAALLIAGTYRTLPATRL